MATVLSRMQEHMCLGGRSTYGWEYAHIEWKLDIENILPEIIIEINQNVKASMAV